jgi:3-dehydroquinate dehydratase-2
LAAAVLVLHGPNLNLLGVREPSIYGSTTLPEIDARLVELGAELGLSVQCLQSNHEGSLIDTIQAAMGRGVAGFLVNAGGLTHSSVSLRDALVGSGRPFVEVHLSNVHAREPFRHRSLLSDVAAGVVVGFGARSYELGLRGLAGLLLRATP